MKLRVAILALCVFALMAESRIVVGWEQDAMKALHANRYTEAERLYAAAAFKQDCSVADQTALLNTNYLREWMDGNDVPADMAKAYWSESAEDRAAVDRAEARDALDEIVRRAASTRIVMLNEHHHVPRSRAFAAELARRLRPLGYDILATETLSNFPPASEEILKRLKDKGYPSHDTGFYSQDPVYGTFLREAMALGYTPAAYETNNFGITGTTEEQIAIREQDQAEHLAEIVRVYPASKFFVYVGHAHLAEIPLGKTPWMGARLKAMTGIDPLTVDQAEFLGSSLAPPSNPAIARLMAKAKRHPVVLFDGGQPLVLGGLKRAIDLQVIHPILPDRHGRPGWLFTSGRKAAKAPAKLRPKDGDILLQVFGEKDGPDAVPVDQLVWRKGAPAPTIAVLRGSVRYVAQPLGKTTCPAGTRGPSR